MTRLLAAGDLILLLASRAEAAIFGTLELVATDVETFDPMVFAAGPNVDVWHIVLTNESAVDVTSLSLSLPGPWQNFVQGGQAFADSPDLPMLGPNTVADSFFVLPPGATELAVDTVDDGTLLSSNYTVAGDTALVPAGGSPTIVATLTTLAGEVTNPIPLIFGFRGQEVIGGEVKRFFPPWPEPSSAALAALAAVGVSNSRRLCYQRVG